MWLRDFLPEHVPTARVMTYGYDSTSPIASIHVMSQNFLKALNLARAESEVNILILE